MTDLSDIERDAVSLYVLGSRDWSEFLDALGDTPLPVLQALRDILATSPGSRTDAELNALLLSCVDREIEARRAAR